MGRVLTIDELLLDFADMTPTIQQTALLGDSVDTIFLGNVFIDKTDVLELESTEICSPT